MPAVDTQIIENHLLSEGSGEDWEALLAYSLKGNQQSESVVLVIKPLSQA